MSRRDDAASCSSTPLPSALRDHSTLLLRLVLCLFLVNCKPSEPFLALYLTREAFEKAKLTEEEFELLEEKEDGKDGDGKGGPKGKGGKKGGGKKKKDKPLPKVTIEFDGLRERLRRLTQVSAPISQHAQRI